MSDFIPYHKIPEASAHWGLDAKAMGQLQRVPWCVTEKIHGANFCWLVSQSDVRCAKRKAILGANDQFFNYRQIKEKLSVNIRQLFTQVAASKTLDELYIYGELFGGSYPHPSLAVEPGLQPVQTGIYYSPTIEFCAFDIAIKKEGVFEYLDYALSIDLCEQAGLFYARPLFVGKMQDAMNYPVRFASRVPEALGLPPLDSPNTAEGIVIKPMQSLQFETAKGLVRPVLKIKIAEFMEDARFHQAKKWQTPQTQGEDEYLLTLVEWDIEMLVTANRLNNAISKVGRLDDQSYQEIKSLLKEDTLEALSQKYGARLNILSEEEKALLEMVLEEKVDTLMEQHS